MTDQPATLTSLIEMAKQKEQELRTLYKQIYAHPDYGKEVLLPPFYRLAKDEKNRLLNSLEAYWELWVIKTGRAVDEVDCFAMAQKWMLENECYSDLNLSLHDIAMQFQHLKNKIKIPKKPQQDKGNKKVKK